MVLKVNVTISPADLTDLYVINDNLPIRKVKRLSNFEVSGNVLIGSIQASQTTDTIRIISSGYVEQILTFSEIQTNPDIVLVSANEAENLSNGTNTYPLADKTARNIIDSLDDVAFNGVRVDQTYDAISTNAQSGTAVAEAISNYAKLDDSTQSIIANNMTTNELTLANKQLINVRQTAITDSGATNVVATTRAVVGTILNHIVSTVSSTSTNTESVGAKCVYDLLETKTNTDLSNLTSQGKNVIDGQWVISKLSLENGTVITTTSTTGQSFTYDLSNYLPNDGNKYEIILNIELNGESGGFYTIYGNPLGGVSVTMCKNYNSVGVCAMGTNSIIPMETSRTLYITLVNTLGATVWWNIAGYRRIGTNN